MDTPHIRGPFHESKSPLTFHSGSVFCNLQWFILYQKRASAHKKMGYPISLQKCFATTVVFTCLAQKMRFLTSRWGCSLTNEGSLPYKCFCTNGLFFGFDSREICIAGFAPPIFVLSIPRALSRLEGVNLPIALSPFRYAFGSLQWGFTYCVQIPTRSVERDDGKVTTFKFCRLMDSTFCQKKEHRLVFRRQSCSFGMHTFYPAWFVCFFCCFSRSRVKQC